MTKHYCAKDKKQHHKSFTNITTIIFSAIMLNGLGLVVILILAGMTGLTIYATYKDCDLLDSKKISKSDQVN